MDFPNGCVVFTFSASALLGAPGLSQRLCRLHFQCFRLLGAPGLSQRLCCVSLSVLHIFRLRGTPGLARTEQVCCVFHFQSFQSSGCMEHLHLPVLNRCVVYFTFSPSAVFRLHGTPGLTRTEQVCCVFHFQSFCSLQVARNTWTYQNRTGVLCISLCPSSLQVARNTWTYQYWTGVLCISLSVLQVFRLYGTPGLSEFDGRHWHWHLPAIWGEDSVLQLQVTDRDPQGFRGGWWWLSSWRKGTPEPEPQVVKPES